MAANESGKLKLSKNPKTSQISDKEQFFNILEKNTLQMPKEMRFLKQFKIEELYNDLSA